MPVGFRHTTSEKVYEFLRTAAKDPSFRKKLENANPAQLSKILIEYGVRVPPREIPAKGKRKVPSAAQCQKLIDTFKLDELYKKNQLDTYDYNPSVLAPLVMMIGFAMPLAAVEVEDEVAAAS